jgi:hypothetical protein
VEEVPEVIEPEPALWQRVGGCVVDQAGVEDGVDAELNALFFFNLRP